MANQFVDQKMRELLSLYDLQDILESLKNISEQQITVCTQSNSSELHGLIKFKWEKAYNILVKADNSLYGQHCGDVKLI